MRSLNQKILNIGIFIFGYFLVYLTFIFRLNEAKSIYAGDIVYYFNNFDNFLSTRILEITHEPTYKLITILAAVVNNQYSIIYLMAFLINILIFIFAKYLNINIVSLLIFYLIFPFAINNPSKYLVTSWRSSSGIFFGLLFCYYFYKNKNFFNLKSFFFFISALFSHSTSIILVCTFTLYTFLKYFIPRFLVKFKLQKKFIGSLLFIILFFLVFIIWTNSGEINYFTSRAGQYLTTYSVNTKSLFGFLSKIFTLLFLHFILKFYYKANQFSKEFQNFLITLYLISIPVAIFAVPLVSDRVVNSVYWVTLLFLLDFATQFLIRAYKRSFTN